MTRAPPSPPAVERGVVVWHVKHALANVVAASQVAEQVEGRPGGGGGGGGSGLARTLGGGGARAT